MHDTCWKAMEKKYYWLKLKRDFFKRHDIQIVESMPSGKEYVIFYLKLLCESIDHDGALRFSDEIPYNAEMLATITHTSPDIVKGAVEVFSKLKMMEVLDDGTLYMSGVERMIGTETQWAAKKREYREAKLLEDKQGQIEDNVQDNVRTMSDKSKSKSKSKREIENIYVDEIHEIISYFNSVTGQRRTESNKQTNGFISARLKEGFAVEDFKKVIDNKWAEWNGTDLEKFMRPETLFAPSHFESYLNQKVKKGGWAF